MDGPTNVPSIHVIIVVADDDDPRAFGITGRGLVHHRTHRAGTRRLRRHAEALDVDALGGHAGREQRRLDLVVHRMRAAHESLVDRRRAAVDAAFEGGTNRLGQLLAPMGIKYVVVVDRPAPEPFAPREVPVPAEP